MRWKKPPTSVQKKIHITVQLNTHNCAADFGSAVTFCVRSMFGMWQ